MPLFNAPDTTLASWEADVLTTGEETVPRLVKTFGATLTSGNMVLSYFTARKTETITQVRVSAAGTASATITLGKIGVFTIAANGDGTQVAVTANTTTLLNSTNASFTTAFGSSFAKVAGQRYAVALLMVGTTAGTVYGQNLFGTEGAIAPRLCGQITSQADIPASFVVGSVSALSSRMYAALLP